jgi:hypothetical protein
MKFIAAFAFVMACMHVSFTQITTKFFSRGELLETEDNKNAEAYLEKALGVVIWEDNFDDTTTWVIDNSGQFGIEYGWNINNNNDGWWSLAGINSTSGGNYAELVNGDPTDGNPGTQALNVVYTLTTAQPIDINTLGGTNQVSLNFQQYGARFNDLQEVQISTDGINFFTISNNLNESVLSSSGGSAYSNPDAKSINLAPYLSSTPESIWVRFSWTTNYPGSATNPNVWITYGWYIDDVAIVTNPGNDLEVVETSWGSVGLNYYQIPTTQVAPIDFTATVVNAGMNEQYNTVLSVDINAGQFSATSQPVTIASLDTAEIEILGQFLPESTTGTYVVQRAISADSIDDVPDNNQIQNLNFSVTDYIYARDNGSVSGNTSNGTEGFETGNLFDIFQDQELKAINIRLAGGGNGTAVGTEIYAKIYEIDPQTGDFVYLAESDPFIVASNNLNTNLVMELQTPVLLSANATYLAVAGSYTAGLKVANAGSSEPQTSFFYDWSNTTWYYQTSTPYVRLNFDPAVGINSKDENLDSFVYPNPSNAILKISNPSGSSFESYKIMDASGHLIVSGPQTYFIDVSGFANGVYTITFVNQSSVHTHRFIKQ